MKNNFYKNIDEKFEYYRKNEIYPIVKKDLVDRIANIKISDSIKENNKQVIERYIEHLQIIKQLEPKDLNCYLKTLKAADIRDNQKLEKVDSFLISLHLQAERKHAIDELLKHDTLDEPTLLKTHSILLKGTSSSTPTDFKYRNNNRTFVGTQENGVRDIHYLTLDINDIDYAMNLFFEYYNSNDSFNEIFIKPYLIHGMLAGLQVFNDGNTRLSRLLQNVKLYKLTNKHADYNFENPALYITKTYFPYRYEYRDLIMKLAINPNEENLNNWIKFNLRKTEDSLYKESENIEKVKNLKR